MPAALLAVEKAFRAHGDDAQANRVAAERRRHVPVLPASDPAVSDLVSAPESSL
jgi:hypothetical protein